MQEQAANDAEDRSSGILMYRSGNIDKVYTFRDLLNRNYIAVSTAELLGMKPYETCVLTYEGESAVLADLAEGVLHCNYPMAVLRLKLRTDEGDKVLRTVLFSRNRIGDGTARDYSLKELTSNLASSRSLPKTGSYSVFLEVTSSTGEVFTPVTVTVNN